MPGFSVRGVNICMYLCMYSWYIDVILTASWELLRVQYNMGGYVNVLNESTNVSSLAADNCQAHLYQI